MRWLTTRFLPDATEGTAYSHTLEATGTATITWALAQGSTLPEGLTLATDGTLSGTPTTTAQNAEFSVTATNDNGSDTQTLHITVAAAALTAPVITTEANLGRFITGKELTTITLAATGSTPITWALASESSLPQGLTLENGTISGTPKADGTFTFTLKAENSEGSDTRTFTIEFYTPTVTISTTEISAGTDASEYNFSFESELSDLDAANSVWTLTGTLPEGLTFNKGTISGTPTTTGTFTFTVKLTNGDYSATHEYTLTIAPAAPVITTTGLPSGLEGEEYSAQLEATGTKPITWTVTGLPEGLACDTNGKISGTPASGFDGKISVKAENDAKNPAEKELQLTIAERTIAINEENFPDEAFREIVSGFDKDNSGSLSTSELKAVTEISARSKDIEILTGIEHFTALVSLDVRDNKLSALDVSKNAALTSLMTAGQVISGVKVETLASGKSAVKLSDYVKGDLAKINASSLKDCEYSDGTATFAAYPASLSYEYDAGFTGEANYMTVTLVTEPQPESSSKEQEAADNTTSGGTKSGTKTDETVVSPDAGTKTDETAVSPDVEAETSSNDVNSYSEIPVEPSLYDETAQSSGLSVSPRFAMPRDSSPDIYSALSSLSATIMPLVNANFLASRDAMAVLREISHDLISLDTPQVLAVVLPVFTVSDDAVYVLRVPVDNVTVSNTAIFWHSFEQSGSSELQASAPSSEAGAVFIDDDGNFANVISGEKFINIAVELKAGTYAPVIAAQANSSDVATFTPSATEGSDNTSGNSTSGNSNSTSGNGGSSTSNNSWQETPAETPAETPTPTPAIDATPVPSETPSDDNNSEPAADNATPVANDESPSNESNEPVSEPVNENNAPDANDNAEPEPESESGTNNEITPEAAAPSAPTVDLTSQSVVEAIANAISRVLGNILGGNVEVSELPADSVTSNRTIDDVSEEQLAAIPSGQKPAVILSAMTVQKTGIYVFGVSLSHLQVGARIFMHLMPNSARSSGFSASAETQEAYTFLDDDGNEVTTVPANKHVNVAAYLEAGTTYEPIISVNDPEAADEVSEPEAQESSGSSSGGGGCDSLQAGFAALMAILFLKRRHS